MLIDEIVKIFEKITSIPHCSGETSKLKEFIRSFVSDHGYSLKEDEAGNLMAYGMEAKITLQAHYDMVCIGTAPRIETVVEGGWMRAKGSSLGADNGMGVAMMLYLVQKRAKCDFLFTNDEEIGLIGAASLGLDIRTPYLLNLDTEEEGKVYIGCAGGEDIYLDKEARYFKPQRSGKFYRIESKAPGGHSGVNIAENIPNAITELASQIVKNETMQIVSIEGGERINAIPSRAEAYVWMPEGHDPRIDSQNLSIKESRDSGMYLLAEGRELAKALFGFAHGVRGWNMELDLPQSSVNLAGISMKKGKIDIALSARAMSKDDLSRLVEQCAAAWEALGFESRREGKYPAWKPKINEFSKTVLKACREVFPDASYAAIHAGLECALFFKRYPELKIASIGPTILDPHSKRERVDLRSVERVMKVVESLVADLSTV